MILTLCLMFLIFAVLGRVIIQYVITGDHGVRPAKSNSTPIQKVSNVLLLGSTLSIGCLVILDYFNQVNRLTVDDPILINAGLVFSIIGLVLIIISQLQMGVSWRFGLDQDENTTLITRGLFKYVRNPIYSGVFIFCIGLLMLLPNIYMLFSVTIAYISIELLVRYVEEPYLRKLHGVKFEAYVCTVGRYIPNIT